jgi:DNA polymerase V
MHKVNIHSLNGVISSIVPIEVMSKMFLPLYSSAVQAGFPSPADDYLEETLDLGKRLVKHPTATFLVKVKGDSMANAGIRQGDILVVDRSMKPSNGNIVVAAINGEFTVKRLKIKDNKIFLVPESNNYSPIQIEESEDTYIWGVVTSCIHEF